jgi:hypothetical protein
MARARQAQNSKIEPKIVPRPTLVDSYNNLVKSGGHDHCCRCGQRSRRGSACRWSLGLTISITLTRAREAQPRGELAEQGAVRPATRRRASPIFFLLFAMAGALGGGGRGRR